jgi:imidazolonepropionase-like amidohydrolase
MTRHVKNHLHSTNHPKKARTDMRLTCDILIPGDGDPIRDAELRLAGGTIEYAGAAAEAPASRETAQHYKVLMPGMWDTHTHFTGQRVIEPAGVAFTPSLVGAIRATRDAAEAIDAGFTSVRELGGYGLSLGTVIDEGIVRGPKIYAAGAALSPTGGHSDLHMYPLKWTKQLGEAEGQFMQCDGVTGVTVAVRIQLRGGARVIKICAGGGMMSLRDDPHHQQFSDEELGAIVQEAARSERIVAAHAHGVTGIKAALRAGARTIEHGSFLDDETAKMMADHGAILVPTLLSAHEYSKLGVADGMPDYAVKKRQENAKLKEDSLGFALAAGVRVAMGTDCAASGTDLPNYWGQNADELGLMVAAGMTPLEAIRAATADAPLTLGPQAPRSGALKVGYDADVIAVADDPSVDVSVLSKRENILQVWKGGVAQKAMAGAAS